jgi:hypothetical protein
MSPPPSPSPYEATRDKWILEHGIEMGPDGPAHSCDISIPASANHVGEGDPTDTIHFEEMTADGEPCGGYRHSSSLMSFGNTARVLSALSRLNPTHEWVVRACAALERERGWSRNPRIGPRARRRRLAVFQPAGPKFHVSSTLNRDSIGEHGLDWNRMGAAPGVAGRMSHDLPATFVEDHLEACDFFIRMARFPVDVWEVNTEGLWAEGGPDGWLMIPEPIAPDRVCLVRRNVMHRA